MQIIISKRYDNKCYKISPFVINPRTTKNSGEKTFSGRL